MNLEDWVGERPDRITPAQETVQRLLEGAARHVADAKVAVISPETRFVSAYTAIRMLADIGLHANGYRVRTSRPGHHIVAIQALSATLGVDQRVVDRLDALRKLRNATEYSGDIIPESAVKECIRQAEALRQITLAWLRSKRRALIR